MGNCQNLYLWLHTQQMTLVESAGRNEKTAADGKLDRSSENFLIALCKDIQKLVLSNYKNDVTVQQRYPLI